ncbi:MAG: cell division protein ZapA [Gammaproteobacteria bacterium]|nr:cell division protein ZapA [Gammaproteobacteria bacterium]
MTDPQPINISILDKDYKVSCPTGEQPALLASARYLDDKMRGVRDAGSIVGSERIAVITALNIANELLSSDGSSQEISPRLKSLESKISQVLEQTRQLEI